MATKIIILVTMFITLSAAYVGKSRNTIFGIPALSDDANARQVTSYSCAGKPDGNYIHPSDCTKFMSCVAETHAYERDCASCHIDPTDCPTGRTHYHHPDDACLWASEAGCVIDPPTTTTTQAPVDPSCDPDDCWVEGYCHDYSWCEREESDHKGKGKHGHRKNDTCDPELNLYFNPNKNDVHGGVCDFWENLDQVTKDKYNSDPNCIDPHCEWKPDVEECSSKYWYFHPEKNDGQDVELHCPSRPDGEQLLWDQARKSCHTCSTVPKKDGSNCC